MEITLLKAGYCTQLENIVKQRGRFKTIKFPATFLLIKHPIKGIVLFDTGYSHHVTEAMKAYPFQIYAWTTPVHIQNGESAKEQLERMNISANDVNYIILSHFHPDHMGGLKDFPNATFICSKHEFEEVRHKKGFSALKKAYIPALLPIDFSKRSIYLEDQPLVETPLLSDIFPFAYDIFGDGSVLGISLPGHTSHQYGIFINRDDKPLFFIADACWLSEAYEHLAMPSKLAKLVLRLNEQYEENIHKLHLLHKKYPEVKIFPCHDERITLTGDTFL